MTAFSDVLTLIQPLNHVCTEILIQEVMLHAHATHFPWHNNRFGRQADKHPSWVPSICSWFFWTNGEPHWLEKASSSPTFSGRSASVTVSSQLHLSFTVHVVRRLLLTHTFPVLLSAYRCHRNLFNLLKIEQNTHKQNICRVVKAIWHTIWCWSYEDYDRTLHVAGVCLYIKVCGNGVEWWQTLQPLFSSSCSSILLMC